MTCGWFNPKGSKANTAKKDYEPIPLNAVVVKKWDNQVPPPDKQVVFITNIDVKDPFIQNKLIVFADDCYGSGKV